MLMRITRGKRGGGWRKNEKRNLRLEDDDMCVIKSKNRNKGQSNDHDDDETKSKLVKATGGVIIMTKVMTII